MDLIDVNGVFLLSNDSTFALAFKPTNITTLFFLVIIHQQSNIIVWTANRNFPVANSDNFMFDTKGSVSLQSEGKVIWEPNMGGQPISSIGLLDSGNMVFYGSDIGTIVWESFRFPTNALLSNQNFVQGMKLSSDPYPNTGNLTYELEIKLGDLILSSRYKTSQIYWSSKQDLRKISDTGHGAVSLARIETNSWKIYDQSNFLLWQFMLPSNPSARNSTWISVLGNDGFLAFYSLGNGASKDASLTIPSDLCGTPNPCGEYLACTSSKCQCPSGLLSRACDLRITDPCRDRKEKLGLVNVGDGLGYFALEFTQPLINTNLNVCRGLCASNCTCLGLLFQKESHKCFLFDWIGSFISDPSNKYSVYVKVFKHDGIRGTDGRMHHKHEVLVIITTTILVTFFLMVMVYGGYMFFIKKKKVMKTSLENSEDENFFGSLSGMPIRYSYKSLEEATNNFSLKLGQGGFGSVYHGKLSDGTVLAVKKLEPFGQGKKEFRAEVSTIGSIRHIHLVRLKGFCVEETHRLLAYEFMANGSLDKWIFNRKRNIDFVLDWPTRFNIALGTAKALAYLHEDCEVKIVHCDIKPENVLLDENFLAKVSDFGLAKLMTKEESHVYTTPRGTRGYLAPEWITNFAISSKSDVYSYGMVLFEIIGGRKNFDPTFTLERSHFPSFAFKMMQEGNFREILDSNLTYEANDESLRIAVKVAFWCVQEDMSRRPSMSLVVQMLEGICYVPSPPFAAFMGVGFSESTLSTLSSVQLSGPR